MALMSCLEMTRGQVLGCMGAVLSRSCEMYEDDQYGGLYVKVGIRGDSRIYKDILYIGKM